MIDHLTVSGARLYEGGRLSQLPEKRPHSLFRGSVFIADHPLEIGSFTHQVSTAAQTRTAPRNRQRIIPSMTMLISSFILCVSFFKFEVAHLMWFLLLLWLLTTSDSFKTFGCSLSRFPFGILAAHLVRFILRLWLLLRGVSICRLGFSCGVSI